MKKSILLNTLPSDLKSGFNVSLLAIPQGMAYALIAGLPLYYGLLGSSIAAILGGLIGKGRFITLGPTNATAVLLFGVFAEAKLLSPGGQLNDTAISILPSIILCSSMMLVLAGTLKISFLIKFISRTVITGYIFAAAILIILNQAKSILGIEIYDSNTPGFIQTTIHIIKFATKVCPASIFLSISTTIIFILLQKYFKALPNVALTLFFGSLIGVQLTNYGYTIRCLSSFDAVILPISIPHFTNTAMHWDIIVRCSFAMSLLCLIEGLSIGKSLASREGERINGDREAISFGFGNFGCALFSGMPASGSLTRSSLNISSGAKSWHSNFFTGVFILVAYFLLDDVVQYIPISVLATIVVFIGLSLLKWNQVITAIHTTRSDAFTFFVTFISGLLISLQVAIFMGVITSILLFLRKVAEPEMIEQQLNEAGNLTNISNHNESQEPEVSIVHVEGELFFAAADLFYEQIRRVGEKRNIKVLILKLLNARHLDATSVLALEELLDYYSEKKCNVILCEVRKDTIRIIKNSGLLSRMNRRNIFPHIPSNPTLSTAKAIKRAKFLVSDKSAKVTIYANELNTKS